MGGKLTEFLIVIELKGNRTETLKGHIIPKRITADNAQEAVAKATTGKIFEEEGFEMIAIQTLLF
jgi:hypothetical protein